MPIDEFIIQNYCLIDDLYKKCIQNPLRQRGPAPKLSDAEVITMEIVGEWMGYHHDKAIYRYFQQHWKHFFPNIPDRSRFLTQGANLWAVKQMIHQEIIKMMGSGLNNIHIVDGFPIKTCVLTRVKRSKVFKGIAAYGFCASKEDAP